MANIQRYDENDKMWYRDETFPGEIEITECRKLVKDLKTWQPKVKRRVSGK